MSRKGNSKRSKMPAAVTPAVSSPGHAPTSSRPMAPSIDFSPGSDAPELTEPIADPAPADDHVQADRALADAAEPDEIPGRDEISVPPIDLNTGFFDRTAGLSDSSLEIETPDSRFPLN